MGLLSKSVKLFPTGKIIAYYKEKGYDAKHMQELEVKIEDLSLCSTILVDVVCDYCGQTRQMKYVDYNAQTKNGTEKCCCLNCAHLKQEETMIKKYGHKTPIQIPEIKEKIQKTNMEKYGSNSPSGNMTVRKRCEETMIKKYGVKYPGQSREIREKIKQTNIEKYGVESPLSREAIKEKIKHTNIERYGVENVLLSPEIKSRRDATLIEKFGTLYPLQNEECVEKLRHTNIDRYGVNYVSQLDDVKEKKRQTFLNKYGVESPSQNEEIKEKIKETNLRKYGVESMLSLPEFHKHSREVDLERYGVYHHLQNPDILAKQKETFYKNGTCPTSQQQYYLYTLYNGELNYQLKQYNIDIYIPDKNLCIEYNGGGHDLRVKLGDLTQEEFNQKEIIRNNIIKREGYKQMRIISLSDKLPSDSVLLKMLSDTEQYFIDYPNHSWVDFDIDASIIRNAEHKDGISYDFGELRKITKAA